MTHIQLGECIEYLIDVLHVQRRPSSREATVEYLADRLGARPKTIYGWCAGRYRPRPRTLAKLAHLGVEELGLDREWARELLYYGNYPQWADLLADLHPQPPDTLQHNLPHRSYLTCIGRATELATLEQWRAHQGGVIVLEGLSGSGKSVVALEMAWRYLEHAARRINAPVSEAVIWYSATPATLTGQGCTPSPPVRPQLTDLFATIGELLSPPDPIAPVTTAAAAYRALRQVSQSLLFIDGAEYLDTPALMQFLYMLPGTTQAVLTSQRHLNLRQSLTLSPLPPDEALALATQECTCHHLALPEDTLRQLVAATCGHPRMLIWAIQRMVFASEPLPIVLATLNDAHSAPQQFIFKPLIQELAATEPETCEWFFRLGAWPTNEVSLAELATATGCASEVVYLSLSRLNQFHLGNFTTPPDHFTLHPFAYQFARAGCPAPLPASGCQGCLSRRSIFSTTLEVNNR